MGSQIALGFLLESSTGKFLFFSFVICSSTFYSFLSLFSFFSVCLCVSVQMPEVNVWCSLLLFTFFFFWLHLIFFWHTDFETWPLCKMDLYSFKFQDVFDDLKFLEPDILIHLKQYFYYTVLGNFIREYNELISYPPLLPQLLQDSRMPSSQLHAFFLLFL